MKRVVNLYSRYPDVPNTWYVKTFWETPIMLCNPHTRTRAEQQAGFSMPAADDPPDVVSELRARLAVTSGLDEGEYVVVSQGLGKKQAKTPEKQKY